MPVLGPDIETAPDATVRTDGLGPADARFAHRRFSFGDFEYRAVTGVRLDPFHDVNHAVQGSLGYASEESRMANHGFFHERIARADRDAMTAGNAARFANPRPPVP